MWVHESNFMAKSGSKRTAKGDAEISKESLVDSAFADVYCQGLAVCTFFDGATQADFEGDAQFGDGFWMHVVIGNSLDGDRTHLHVDLKRRFQKKRKATSTFPKLIDQLHRFNGILTKCWIRAEYVVPVAELPSRGVIGAFLGLATSAGGYDMAFRGATMKIDDPLLDELRWQADDEKQSINIMIDGFCATIIGPGYLDKSSNTMHAAFRTIVLQEGTK